MFKIPFVYAFSFFDLFLSLSSPNRQTYLPKLSPLSKVVLRFFQPSIFFFRSTTLAYFVYPLLCLIAFSFSPFLPRLKFTCFIYGRLSIVITSMFVLFISSFVRSMVLLLLSFSFFSSSILLKLNRAEGSNKRKKEQMWAKDSSNLPQTVPSKQASKVGMGFVAKCIA